MRLIGICGRSGSGKSVFCEKARECGFYVIDCDKVYASLVGKYTDCLAEIEANFGSEVIKNNALDRKTMSAIVFSDSEKLSLLNNITHKYVTREVENIIFSSPDNVFILDAPTLFESGLDKKCDTVISVVTSDELSVKRITERDGLTVENAKKRLASQKTNEFLISESDVIIYNESDLNSFEAECASVCRMIKEGTI